MQLSLRSFTSPSSRLTRALWLWLACGLAFVGLASPSVSETRICEGASVSVNASQVTHADMACEAVKRAVALFEHCKLPPLPEPLKIDLIQAIHPGCVGQYHCGDGLVEVLAPSGMAAVRPPDTAFSFLPTEDYFQSVIIHELTHALFDEAPCPFKSCVVANEYAAYTMQVMSLTPMQQAKFADNEQLGKKVSRQELSSMIYMMAPNLFAQKAWAHLMQRNDACTYLRDIFNGTIVLDRERF